jgi:hypothetical protein
MNPDGEGEESGHADEAHNRGHHQAADAAQHKPKQGSNNLAAIQGRDWQRVEDEQPHVDAPDRVQKCLDRIA